MAHYWLEQRNAFKITAISADANPPGVGQSSHARPTIMQSIESCLWVRLETKQRWTHLHTSWL